MKKQLLKNDDREISVTAKEKRKTSVGKRKVHFRNIENRCDSDKKTSSTSAVVVEDETFLIPSLNDLTRAEHNSVWWSQAELMKMNQSAMRISHSIDPKKVAKTRKLFKYMMEVCEDDDEFKKFYWKREKSKQKQCIHADTDVSIKSSKSNKKKKSSPSSVHLNNLDETTGTFRFLDIVKWCRDFDRQRGLERWTCYQHCNDREEMYSSHRNKVMIEQARLRKIDQQQQRTGGTEERKKLSVLEKEESLRRVAEAGSKQALNIAILFGAADSVILKIENNEFSLRRSYLQKLSAFGNRVFSSSSS